MSWQQKSESEMKGLGGKRMKGMRYKQKKRREEIAAKLLEKAAAKRVEETGKLWMSIKIETKSSCLI
jgi:hypothetical protein